MTRLPGKDQACKLRRVLGSLGGIWGNFVISLVAGFTGLAWLKAWGLSQEMELRMPSFSSLGACEMSLDVGLWTRRAIRLTQKSLSGSAATRTQRPQSGFGT